MTFSKGNVFTALDAENVKPGTRVLVANNLDELKHKVNAYGLKHEIAEPATVIEILDESCDQRFTVKYDDIEREYAAFYGQSFQ